MQYSRNMKNQRNMTPPKYHNNLPVTNPKDMRSVLHLIKNQNNCFKEALCTTGKHRETVQQNQETNT